MDPKDFNQYRSEILWPKIVQHLTDAQTSGKSSYSHTQAVNTVPDYLRLVLDHVPNKSWCEENQDELHIFTRYYPYSEQPVTLILDNPRLDYGGEDEEGSNFSNEFPTLEHRRYAVTDPEDVGTLTEISAEHYNSYFYNENKGRECLLKRLGTITDSLNISDVVKSLPEEFQWNGDVEADISKIGARSNIWSDYFYNPEKDQGKEISAVPETNPPSPERVLPNTEGVKCEDQHLSAQSPDLSTGFYSDFYITNVYKLGTPEFADISTDKEVHIKMTTEEVTNAGSKLVIAMGVDPQKVLIELGTPVYEPKDGKYSNPKSPGQENYGVIWQLSSDQYGIAVPHPSRFNSLLAQPFSGNSDEGWRILSEALQYLGDETDL